MPRVVHQLPACSNEQFRTWPNAHRYTRRMRRQCLGWLLLLLAATACTQPNPGATCKSGSCSDPAFPYCDADGFFAPEPGLCIAVSCRPGEVALCDGDDAITCAGDGASYVRAPCDLGCLPSPTPHCAPPACDVSRPFDPPVPVEGINTAANETNAWLSSDQLTIYFTRTPPSSIDKNVYRATRSQPSGAFSDVIPLNGINTTAQEQRPVLSGDGLTLYVETYNNPTFSDISMSTRTSTAAEFVGLSPVSGLSSPSEESGHWISHDELTVYFALDAGTGGFKIHRAARASVAMGFGAASPVPGVNAATGDDYSPVFSDDGLEIFFVSSRGNTGGEDIYHAVRTSKTADFGTPTMVSELSIIGNINDGPNWLSADRCQLVFYSERVGGNGGMFDIWIATRP